MKRRDFLKGVLGGTTVSLIPEFAQGKVLNLEEGKLIEVPAIVQRAGPDDARLAPTFPHPIHSFQLDRQNAIDTYIPKSWSPPEVKGISVRAPKPGRLQLGFYAQDTSFVGLIENRDVQRWRFPIFDNAITPMTPTLDLIWERIDTTGIPMTPVMHRLTAWVVAERWDPV